MRLFIGVPLAEAVTSELAAVCARLRSGSGGLRWSAPESWHITLQFLGNATGEQYTCLVPQLRAVHSVPVAIQLGELGFFDRAGIFFAGVELAPQLIVLQQRVTQASGQCGFDAEDRSFHPHITLARGKDNDKGRELKGLERRLTFQPEFPRFIAHEFLLYESHLGPAGSSYEIRETFPFGR